MSEIYTKKRRGLTANVAEQIDIDWNSVKSLIISNKFGWKLMKIGSKFDVRCKDELMQDESQ